MFEETQKPNTHDPFRLWEGGQSRTEQIQRAAAEVGMGAGSLSGSVFHFFNSGNTYFAKHLMLRSASSYGIPPKLKLKNTPLASIVSRTKAHFSSTWSGVPHGISIAKSRAATSGPVFLMNLLTLL